MLRSPSSRHLWINSPRRPRPSPPISKQQLSAVRRTRCAKEQPMLATRKLSKSLIRVCSVFCLAVAGCSQPQPPPAPAPQPLPVSTPPSASTADSSSAQNGRMPTPQVGSTGQDQDEEVQMGQEVFQDLKAKGEIIAASPLYDELRPIADAITRAAQPHYNHPFRLSCSRSAAERVCDPGWQCLRGRLASLLRQEQGRARRNVVP